MVHLTIQHVEHVFTMRNKPVAGKFIRRTKMFLVEEKRNGQRRAEIYMRTDGLFEGRIYRPEPEPDCGRYAEATEKFEICGVAETLPRVETLVDEELGL